MRKIVYNETQPLVNSRFKDYNPRPFFLARLFVYTLKNTFLKIFIIDDDSEDREFLIRALMSINPELTILEFAACIDGIEDSELEFEMPPDYIFLDIHIPRTNGIDCLKKIKNKKAYKDVPIIIISTSTDHRDKEDCIRGGASAYLVKPNSYAALIKVLNSVGVHAITN